MGEHAGPLKRPDNKENQEKTIEMYEKAKDTYEKGKKIAKEYYDIAKEYYDDAKEVYDFVKKYNKEIDDALKNSPLMVQDETVATPLAPLVGVKDTVMNTVDDTIDKANEIKQEGEDFYNKAKNEYTEKKDFLEKEYKEYNEKDELDYAIDKSGAKDVMDKDLGVPLVNVTPRKIAKKIARKEPSVVCKLEPSYVGDEKTNYNYRIYTFGSVTCQELHDYEVPEPEFTPPEFSMNEEGIIPMPQLEQSPVKVKPADYELDLQSLNKDKAEGRAQQAMDKVVTKIKAGPQARLFLHFDIFGFERDHAVKKFIENIDKFRQLSNVNNVDITFKKLFKYFNNKEEAKSSISGDVSKRFRHLRI